MENSLGVLPLMRGEGIVVIAGRKGIAGELLLFMGWA